MKIFLILICVFAIIVASIYLFSPKKIKNISYSLTTNKINQNIKIVALSDLHSSYYSLNQAELINKVKKEKPDLIFLLGDMFDESRSPRNTQVFLNGIKDLCPIYFCYGNHENYRIKNSTREILESFGVNVLENKTVIQNIKGQKISICGIEEMDYPKPHATWSWKLNKLNSELDLESYCILLSHRPTGVSEYKKTNFDLVLSGHSHGGQWQLPLINGLYTPDEKFFPKYAGGKYNLGSNSLIVTRGLCLNNIPRLFNSPEIATINVIAKK